MGKYIIKVPYDYVSGYLRYGHRELEIEANSLEEAKKYLDNKENREFFVDAADYILDDYSWDDSGDLEYEYVEVEEVNNG